MVCEAWQLERMRAEWATTTLVDSGRVRFHDGIVGREVGWSADASVFDGDGLLTWHHRLGHLAALQSADLVLSDNLTGVLHHRPDAVVLGSFLWSDVLGAAHPGHPTVARFVEEEHEVLHRCNPKMLCVKGFAMPGVLTRTDAVQLPLMCAQDAEGTARCPRARRPSALVPRVGVLFGATNNGMMSAVELATALLSDLGVEVAVPVDLMRYLPGDDRCVNFSFSAREYHQIDVVVCRPGMGTITDCVAYAVPMVLTHEVGNVELEHNGRCAQGIGLGIYVGACPRPEDVVEAVRSLIGTTRADRTRRVMAGVGRNGIEQSLALLLTILDGNGCSEED